MHKIFWNALLWCPLIASAAQLQNISSKYTSLHSADCKTIEQDAAGGGYLRSRCNGVAGYRIERMEVDSRQTINLIAPNGDRTELDLARHVGSGFSSVGERAEWRIATRRGRPMPTALIVRFTLSTDPGQPQRAVSYLVVSKIDGARSCVTDIVTPDANANAKARKLADAASRKSCRTEARKN